MSAPSLLGHFLNDDLNHPLGVFVAAPVVAAASLQTVWAPLQTPLPCDVHLVNLRSLGAGATAPAALILHRRGARCGLVPTAASVVAAAPVCADGDGRDETAQLTGRVDLGALFRAPLRRAEEHTLSLMHKVADAPAGAVPATVQLDPMEVYTFKVEFA